MAARQIGLEDSDRVPTSGSATYTVATVDDSTDEANGAVTATLNAGTGYTLHPTASQRFASRDGQTTTTIRRPTTGPAVIARQQNVQSGESEQRSRDPQPLQLALWTDRPAYRAGDTVPPVPQPSPPMTTVPATATFVWLGMARRRGAAAGLASLSGRGPAAAPTPSMSRGPARERLDVPRRPSPRADRELALGGARSPELGLWQFVMELRPGDGQRAGTRNTRTRKWPSFPADPPGLGPVRGRRTQPCCSTAQGFDREIRTDLTLRSRHNLPT